MTTQKRRIYEIARDFNVSSDAVIRVLRELHFEVKNHMSTVTAEMGTAIEAKFSQAQAQAKVEDTKRRELQAAIEQHRVDEARAQAAAAAPPPPRAVEQPRQGMIARAGAPPSTGPSRQQPPSSRPGMPSRPNPTGAPRPTMGPSNRPGGNAPTMQQRQAPSQSPARPGGPPSGQRPGGPSFGHGGGGPGSGPRGRFEQRKKPQVDQRAALESYQKTMAELEGPGRIRRRRRTQGSGVAIEENENIVQAVEMMPLHDLATELGVRPQELITKCIKNGVMATMNSRLDRDTIEFLVTDYGYEVEFVTEFDVEEATEVETPAEALPRPPVVTIMGHVDHGKTSILDYIRKANVIAGEAGGITQHIGAYEVTTATNHQITFLDTPGHEAFTAMRARGAQVTDLVVIVIAANDGIMPQTVEAINHARAAGVPFMIAVNKVDLPDANVDRIKQQLTQHTIVVEEYGGSTVVTEVSAKTGKGIDHLLEMINIQAELLELRAPRAGRARGVVLEAQKSAQHGVIVNLMVRSGTLRVGDVFVAGRFAGRVRALLNERGRRIEEVLPGAPVQVLGCDGVPQAGDPLMVVEDDREARDIAARRQQYERAREAKAATRVTLEELYKQIQQGELRELKLILKADVDGSVEALSESLEKLSNQEVAVRVIHRGVGGINESDVSLAVASNAVILGFHVRPKPAARDLAKREQVDIQLFEIIYEAVESVKKALEGMLEPEKREVIEGNAEVRNVFKVPKAGTVAGCYVTSGSFTRNGKVRVLREHVVVYDSTISSLRRFKDDVKEVATGFECGIGVSNFDDLKVGDVLETYRVDQVSRTL